MEKTIMIDGREVRLRASAAIPRLYRIKFRGDIIQDMKTIQKAVVTSRPENQVDGQDGAEMSTVPLEALELFENGAYRMAMHADPAVPSTVEEWLDGLETFAIYTVFPAIEELWMANVKQLSIPVKK